MERRFTEQLSICAEQVLREEFPLSSQEEYKIIKILFKK